jgi:kynurenine formamidase
MNDSLKYIYLSYFLDHLTPLYGGDKGISISPHRSILKGDTANTKQLSLQNHSGTHIDFPNHFFENGKTSENYTADFWMFDKPFLVNRKAEENEIFTLSDDEMNMIPNDIDFLIIKTGFGEFRSEEKYWKHNPGFAPIFATKLRVKFPNLKVIGMDFISLTSYQNRELGREAHRMFLGGDKPILLIEDMDLSKIMNTPMSISCLPLLISGIDGTPVTVIAKT